MPGGEGPPDNHLWHVRTAVSGSSSEGLWRFILSPYKPHKQERLDIKKDQDSEPPQGLLGNLGKVAGAPRRQCFPLRTGEKHQKTIGNLGKSMVFGPKPCKTPQHQGFSPRQDLQRAAGSAFELTQDAVSASVAVQMSNSARQTLLQQWEKLSNEATERYGQFIGEIFGDLCL